MLSCDERIDLILADRKCYTFEGYAANKVSSCLKIKGVKHNTIYLEDGIFNDYLVHIQEDPPAWTLSFTNWNKLNKPLCDVIQIPHFFWLEGSFTQAIPYLDTKYGKVGISDKKLTQQLATKQFVFLPPGVAFANESVEKKFDLVLFAPVADPLLLEKIWENTFTPEEICTIKEAVSLGDPLAAKSYFLYVEDFLKAIKTLEIIKQFKKVRLDIFGKHAGKNWLIRLPRNIYLHAELPYCEHLEVLKLSKLAVIEPESPWYGAALGADCLPVAPVEQEVEFYLAHPLERERKLSMLQEKLLGQSWEKQTELLLESMP